MPAKTPPAILNASLIGLKSKLFTANPLNRAVSDPKVLNNKTKPPFTPTNIAVTIARSFLILSNNLPRLNFPSPDKSVTTLRIRFPRVPSSNMLKNLPKLNKDF